ncbi:MAG: hypothetical protein COB78_10970 [Hyphomicrobiales bacterium]|nr:MAG: hypothetical protein COB78_10970 [Hyphomicrobiales bacterium]
MFALAAYLRLRSGLRGRGALAPVAFRSPPKAEVDTDGIEQGNGPINFLEKNESPKGECGNPALMRRAFAGPDRREDMPVRTNKCLPTG